MKEYIEREAVLERLAKVDMDTYYGFTASGTTAPTVELAWARRTSMNDMEQLLLIVLTALACPLVLPALLDEKENDND